MLKHVKQVGFQSRDSTQIRMIKIESFAVDRNGDFLWCEGSSRRPSDSGGENFKLCT